MSEQVDIGLQRMLSRRGSASFVRHSPVLQDPTPDTLQDGPSDNTTEALPDTTPSSTDNAGVFDVFSGYEPDNSAYDEPEPTPPPAQPKQDDRELEHLRSMLQAAEDERNSIRAEREREAAELRELRELRDNIEAERLYDFSNLELETVDRAVVQELGNKVIKPVVESQRKEYERGIGSLREQLEQVNKERLALQKQLEAQSAMTKRESTNAKIYEVHPDFDAIRNSKAFNKFLESNVANSSVKIGAMVTDEYYKGNYQFVNNAIAAFKQRHPDINSIASVSASANSGTAHSADNAEPPSYTEQDLIYELRSRLITRDEYRAKLQKLNEHR